MLYISTQAEMKSISSLCLENFHLKNKKNKKRWLYIIIGLYYIRDLFIRKHVYDGQFSTLVIYALKGEGLSKGIEPEFKQGNPRFEDNHW